MQSGSSGEVRSGVGAADTRGKHRISAELKRLEQEIRFLEVVKLLGTENKTAALIGWTVDFSLCRCLVLELEEELEQLEKTENASAACKESFAPRDHGPSKSDLGQMV
ncbi:hypothetical protein SASPL_113704 [Salvia splendens]|uniref:Uncharacterized protein n=1 Tax=Salvia splendens TaxID=180675 RepID=A0A8X9A0I2_SALSN|nr:hypothetical protein SASPL_113704 [Salvia splendens]